MGPSLGFFLSRGTEEQEEFYPSSFASKVHPPDFEQCKTGSTTIHRPLDSISLG
jgi:hypothetical protein